MLARQLVAELEDKGGDPDGSVTVLYLATYYGVTSAGQVSGSDPVMTVIEAGTHPIGITRTQLIDKIMEQGGDPEGEAELFIDGAYFEIGEVFQDDEGEDVSPAALEGIPMPTVIAVGNCTAT